MKGRYSSERNVEEYKKSVLDAEKSSATSTRTLNFLATPDPKYTARPVPRHLQKSPENN